MRLVQVPCCARVPLDCFALLFLLSVQAVSLGYFDTLMSASAASTSSELTTMELEGAGIRWVVGHAGGEP